MRIKKMKNKAFTLTELLIALGVIGILAAVLFPIISNIVPDQDVIMAKRAYYTIQQGVADLINDQSCYPDLTNASESEKKDGFDDGAGYEGCNDWNQDKTANSALKFATLFSKKTDYVEDDDGNIASGDWKVRELGEDEEPDDIAIGDNDLNFQTKDGMSWYITSDGSYNYILVDVNGADGDNCFQSEISGISDKVAPECASGENPDKFAVRVKDNGHLTILDSWAKDAVKVNKNISDGKKTLP